jgi:hypothetical protein
MRREELIDYLQARVDALCKENDKLTELLKIKQNELHKSLQ